MARLTWNGNAQAEREYQQASKKLKPRKKSRVWKKKHKKQHYAVATDYYAYMKSPAWQAKRKKFIKFVGGKCQECGNKNGLQVHHKHYNTLGRETQNDVIVVCSGCHSLKHEKDGATARDDLSQQFRSMFFTT
jgi:5-methylcytosine-specific restriction endonuclease McrA